MPKPVHKPKGTDTESLWEWAIRDSPELLAEFEAGYEDSPIIGGECKRCWSHVVENNEGHKRWHKEMNFAIWIVGSAWRALVNAEARS